MWRFLKRLLPQSRYEAGTWLALVLFAAAFVLLLLLVFRMGAAFGADFAFVAKMRPP